MGRSLGGLWILLFLLISCGGGDQSTRTSRAVQGIDTTSPTWPSPIPFSAVLRTPTRIRLEWGGASDDTGVVAYDIYRSTPPSVTLLGTVSGGEQAFTVTGLSPGTNYPFIIRARDAANNVSTDLPGTFSTQGASSAPTWVGSSTPTLTAPAVGKRQVHLRWTAATDDYDEFSYNVWVTGGGLTGALLGGVRGAPGQTTIDWVSPRTLTPATSYSFVVQAVDDEGHGTATSLSLSGQTTLAVTDPPVWMGDAEAQADRMGWSSIAVHATGVGLDADHYVFSRRPASGTWAPWTEVSTSSAFAMGEDFDPGRTWEFRVHFVDEDNVASADLETELELPAPGTATPPPLDPSQASDLVDMVSFLYTGTDPPQEGVDTDAVVRERVAIIHGRVLRRTDGEAEPLAGVQVFERAHGEPIFGRTFTHDDGTFEYVVHGGGTVTLEFRATGMLPVQRTVRVEWGVPTTVPDVALIPASSTTTSVTFDNTWHVAQGDEVTDDSGTRTPVVLFPPDTTATMVLDDESEEELDAGTLRMTEYTVGDRGPAAMPGTMTANVAYTWAAEFAFDEAVAANARRVDFSQPVAIYVENFLDFPIGTLVPSGYYDDSEGVWYGNELGNGVTLHVLSSTDSGGGAEVDVDDDSDYDGDDETILSAQGLAQDERIRLHTLYPSGAELWRFRVQHFSKWDSNWGINPPDDARAPSVKDKILHEAMEHVVVCPGSAIECQNRGLGDDIPLTGTPFFLHYGSDRAPGRLNTLDIPLGELLPNESALPASLTAANVIVTFPDGPQRQGGAGTPEEIRVAHAHFNWNGMDHGRRVLGPIPVGVEVQYVYRGSGAYGVGARFGYNGANQGGQVSITGSQLRQEIVFSTFFTTWIGGMEGRGEGLGGWTLNAHHAYDPRSGNVHLGGGGVLNAGASGNGTRPLVEGSSTAENVAATSAAVEPYSIAVGTDGSIWYSESYRVRRITPSGTVVTMAGILGNGGCGADGAAATSSAIGGLSYITLVNDRILIISETSCHRIRAVFEDGSIHTIAGTGSAGFDGDDLAADSSRLDGPKGIAVLDGNSLLIADTGNRLIRRLDLSDFHLRTIVGNTGFTFPSGSSVPSLARTLMSPYGVDVGPQGEVVFTDTLLHRVFRLGIDGTVTTIAGDGTSGFLGDNGLATSARLDLPSGVRVRPDGTVVVADSGNGRIREIGRDGRITTLAGHGALTTFDGWGRPATSLALSGNLPDVAVTPSGATLIADHGFNHIAQIRGGIPMESGTNVFVPSPSGEEIYQFNRHTGCHLATLDGVSNEARYTFVYALGDCRPTGVVIGDPSDGNTVAIHRASDTDVRIRSPFYASSGEEVLLDINSDGFLEGVTHGDDTWVLDPDANGMLLSLTDPQTREHTFTYTPNVAGSTGGLLMSDASPAGVVTRLSTDTRPDAEVFTVRRILGTSTATGPVYVHTVRSLPNGGRQYVDVSPGGDGSHTVTSTTTVQPDGHEETVVTSGSTTLSTSASETTADPRLGARASYTSAASSTTAGRTLSTHHTRTTTATSAVPPVLTAQTDESYVNSETSPRVTTQYDASHADCDDYARVLETTRGGRTVRRCMDARGRVASVQVLGASPTMYPVQFHYDSRGRMDQVTQGSRRVVSTWRSDGRPDETQAGVVSAGVFTALQTTGSGYNTARRLTSQTLPGSRTVGLAFSSTGELLSLTPPGRDAHTMTHDDDGRMETFTSPAPDAMSDPLELGWSYNARRQLTRHTRADGSHVDLDYDDTAMGHLETVTFPNTGVVSYGYRAATGSGETVSASGCRLRTVYDSETVPTDTVLENATSGSCPVTGTVSRTVNALFETTSVTVGDAPAVAFVRDADTSTTVDQSDDRLLTSAGGMTLGRDGAIGRLTGTSVGLVETAATFTTYGELASDDAEVNGSLELGLGYTYDDLGRIESVAESGHLSRTTEYGYDSAGRLETVTRGSTTIESYAYAGSDGENGNRTSWTNGAGSFTATYDAQDRLTSTTTSSVTTSYGYDDHGQLTSRTTGSATTTYAWDDRGALLSVTRPGSVPVINYVLDPQGRRIGRKLGSTLERGWLYAGGLHPVAEVDSDGTTVRRVFVYATRTHSPDLVLQRDGSSWVTYRVLSDHLGSVRAVVKASDGIVVQRMDYDAFGRVVTDWVASGWVPLPFGYAGGLYDRDTGLVRFGAREYDASVGRWLSRDPIHVGGGDSNFYAYVKDDPENLVDPTGHFPACFERMISTWMGGQHYRNNTVPISPFAFLGGPTRMEHRNRNQNNVCPVREPMRGQEFHESNRRAMFDTGLLGTGAFGGKWRFSDGSECAYDSQGNWQSGGTFNFSPIPYGIPFLTWLNHAILQDFGAHWIYGGESGYEPDATRRY